MGLQRPDHGSTPYEPHPLAMKRVYLEARGAVLGVQGLFHRVVPVGRIWAGQRLDTRVMAVFSAPVTP